MAARVAPVLSELSEAKAPVLVIAHSGVIRAALGTAMAHLPGGLACEVATWSLTRLRPLGQGRCAIIATNWSAP